MSAGWVAGSVRARAMTRRRVGNGGARAIAGSLGVGDAVDTLARSPYAPRVRTGDSLTDAGHGVRATVLWNLRVLAGWLPADGAEMLRALAGWFEIANVDEHLRALDGRPAGQPFELGTLATAWPLLAATGSRDELRDALTASRWGDPGGSTVREIQLAMRLSWAARIVSRVLPARAWALGGAALLVARELLGRGVALPPRPASTATALLGPGWTAASTLDGLRAALPPAAGWALDGIGSVRDLWRAEIAWWQRVRADATRLAARSGFGADPVIGAAALLAADAWLVLAAMEVAARAGAGDRAAVEAFDVLA